MNLELMDDAGLVAGLKEDYRAERKLQAAFLRKLSEVDRRHLWAKLSYSSFFEFCVEELKLSGGSACRRIQVCRMAEQYPFIYALIEYNEITLTNLSLLSPCLTEGNARELVFKARGLSKYEVEKLCCAIRPKAEPRDTVTPLLVKDIPQESEKSYPPVDIKAPERTTRVRITYTADEKLIALQTRLKELLAHKFPDCRLEDIEREVYEFYLSKHDPLLKKERLVKSPVGRGHSRYISASVRREVWKQAKGQCVHVDENQRRCASRFGLQIDHIVPFCLGGRSDAISNLRLVCRAHNLIAAEAKLTQFYPPITPRSEGGGFSWGRASRGVAKRPLDFVKT